MKKVLLVGGGKIGSAITESLGHTGDYADCRPSRRGEFERLTAPNVVSLKMDIADAKALVAAAKGHDMVVSAAPYNLTPAIAEAALKAGAHYFDLTEDVESTCVVKQLAAGADSAFVPQCGLAPGYISIVAADVARKFDKLREVEMRVGALPVFLMNALKYNLTWFTDGYITNTEPCANSSATAS